MPRRDPEIVACCVQQVIHLFEIGRDGRLDRQPARTIVTCRRSPDTRRRNRDRLRRRDRHLAIEVVERVQQPSAVASRFDHALRRDHLRQASERRPRTVSGIGTRAPVELAVHDLRRRAAPTLSPVKHSMKSSPHA